jgi:Domain of unknown function (DUF397)
MGGINLEHVQWRKSSYSSANGACVEVARNLRGLVAVRDSKNPADPVMIIRTAEWRIFIRALKASESSL